MSIEPAVCFLWALLLLLLPLKWLAAALLSVTFHELCHLAALYIIGRKPDALRLGLTGCCLDIPDLTPWEELGCALAGPMGSLFLLVFARLYPQLALCALFHGLYNLIPVYPLDGGRALLAAASLILPPQYAQSVCAWIKWFAIFAVTLIFLCSKLRFLFLSAVLLVLGRYLAGKIPCKPSKLRVQ